MPELLAGLAKWEQEMPEDPFKRQFAKLKRGEDGKYEDDELVDIICDSIEDVAGKYHFPPLVLPTPFLHRPDGRHAVQADDTIATPRRLRT